MYRLVIENLTQTQAELLANWINICDEASDALDNWWLHEDNPEKNEEIPLFSDYITNEQNQTVTIVAK